MHFGVSATDLIDASQTGITLTSVTLTGGVSFGGEVVNFNDGSQESGAAGYTGNGFCPNNGAVMTVVLDTSVNPLGYDIGSIVSLTGGADNETDCVSQGYDAEHHVVGGGDTWTTLANVAQTFTGTGGEVYGGELKVTITDTGATGVDQLRFTFHNNPDISIYREIDVQGTPTPEPATMALLAVGGIAAILRRKRRA